MFLIYYPLLKLLAVNLYPFNFAISFILVYDPNHQLFILNFRGLSFSFPIDSKFEVRLSFQTRNTECANK